MNRLGHKVLAIYADSVFLEYRFGDTIPMLPEGWRLQATLTRLQFLNDVSFVADEMAKLPGITDAERAVLQRRYRRLAA
jgi:hypothetical protein